MTTQPEQVLEVALLSEVQATKIRLQDVHNGRNGKSHNHQNRKGTKL
ncbi:hypothetical protein [Pseudotamlana haliotis]|nr:hypothetical protein [Tamlana haliotis]